MSDASLFPELPIPPTPAAPGLPGPAGVDQMAALSAEHRLVLAACALGWTGRARSWIYQFLQEWGQHDHRGKRFTHEVVQQRLRELAEAGWLVERPMRAGFWRVAPAVRGPVYLAVLDQHPHHELRQALYRTLRFDLHADRRWFTDLDSASEVVRFEVWLGAGQAELGHLQQACRYDLDWATVLMHAVERELDLPLFQRMPAWLQLPVLRSRLSQQVDLLPTDGLPLVALAEAQLAALAGEGDPMLRLLLSLQHVGAGRVVQSLAVVEPLQQGDDDTGSWQAYAVAVAAAGRALQGRWAEAEAGFDLALALLKDMAGKRKNLLPERLAMFHVLALLAQQTPAHLNKALKFCLAESGKRQPSADSGWGLAALAVQMRQGDSRADTGVFRPLSLPGFPEVLDLWRWLLRAWLRTEATPGTLSERDTMAAKVLREHLQALDAGGLVTQLDQALKVLQDQPTTEPFFAAAVQAGWHHALAALAAIGGGSPVADEPAGDNSRLVWQLAVNADGAVTDLLPLQQTRGPRGWGKAKELPLSKLAKAETLPPHDAAVARALRPLPGGMRGQRLDLTVALPALLGHPALELADAPGVLVQLVEGQPELDVTEHGDELQLRLFPPLRSGSGSRPPWPLSAAEQKEAEALLLMTVLRDGPQRARLVRLTPAQKRAAQLIGQKLLLPREALPQLQPVLQGLGAHFQVHADAVPAAGKVRQMPADARLRAELAPQGDGLTLRLVVAPLGLEGPRLSPGHGRARLMAAVSGETLSAERDLAQEMGHLEAVLDACPMLPPLPEGMVPEWQIDEPDEALALVERLPTLNALSGVDWPKGKRLNVDTVALGQLKLQLRSGREWLQLQGGIQVDESLVFGLEQLLQWRRSGSGRFVPMGEGRFLALTQELRTRLDELDTVAQTGAKGQPAGELRVAPLAAAWLADTLDGAALEADAAFKAQLGRLESAQALQPVLPAALQAELRPYQQDGYAWAMRLASAGFGAVLADDMGLGKTLQALAVLVARAAGGPALVVAPTSLGGNWLAETQRFAPGLNLQLFGEGERAAQREAVAAAGPGDVVMVSYPLLLLEAEAFTGRRWHTLVLDEAQAIKNAAAKRAQAAFELQADFRLALSGTPVENRLSELWSIMRVCNPGLLGTLPQFNARFAAPIERGHNRVAQRTLRRLIAPFVLRRTKAQVLDDLPPRTEQTLRVVPEAAELAHYEALRREALAEAEHSVASDKPGQAQFNILAQLTRLRRAACDPRLVSPQLGLVGAKVQAFAALAAELSANGHKALVFSQFVDFLSLLREPLDAAGITYQYLDGSTPAAERTRRVAAFQAGEGDLFLISLKAGGFGLNLTVADYVVIADPWWNPAAEDQASGRAHRIGQQRPVTVYRLVNQGTLEERIVALHQQKRELADGVLEGGEVGVVPKAEELVALMRGQG